MLYQPTIAKTRIEEAALDHAQLFAIGLGWVQQLASEVWTDYNVHDPGITTLELLSYTLTDLSYRASMPVQDLLAAPVPTPPPPSPLFTARRILPNRALTF